MKKLESTFLNMVIVLTMISVFSAYILGLTYSRTKKRIESAQAQNQKMALRKVLPEFDNDPGDSLKDLNVRCGEKDHNLTVYFAKKNGELTGRAYKTYSEKGFSGRIDLITGFDTDGYLKGIKVLSHQETPGLGSKMTEDSFISRFTGKSASVLKNIKVKKDDPKNGIDALTAATISSRAFCDAVQKAAKAELTLRTNESGQLNP